MGRQNRLTSPKPIAFVLLSGGADSTTCLYQAFKDYDGNVEAISIDYGQRHKKELEYAKKSCAILGVPHSTLNLKHIVPNTMLTDKKIKVPHISYDKIKGVSPTYVPFRNGLMLSALASYVHGTIKKQELTNRGLLGSRLLESAIYFGAHSEDAKNWAYPDCTPEFIGSMANAIFIGTYQQVRLRTPLMWLMKHEIIKLGTELGVNWALTWSCYKGERRHCGKCPTCLSRRAAFQVAGVEDPTCYAAD